MAYECKCRGVRGGEVGGGWRRLEEVGWRSGYGEGRGGEGVRRVRGKSGEGRGWEGLEEVKQREEELG